MKNSFISNITYNILIGLKPLWAGFTFFPLVKTQAKTKTDVELFFCTYTVKKKCAN